MTQIVNGPQALAEAVKQRRAELGWTQTEIANRAGLSLDRVQAIEATRHATYRLTTLNKIDRALCWSIGSAASVLEGGEVLGEELEAEPPTAYRVEVLTTGQSPPTVRFYRANPTWKVSPSGDLNLIDEDGTFATFAAGFWRSVVREEVSE